METSKRKPVRSLDFLVKALLLFAVFFFGACRVDTQVAIRVNEDGSGEVTVQLIADDNAVALIADAPNGLQLDDLADAGWTITENTTDNSQALTIEVSKRFTQASMLGSTLAEIAGEGIIFEDFELTKKHNFDVFGWGPAHTNYTLQGTINPTFDVEQLGGVFPQGLPPLGRSAELVESEFAGNFEDALGLTVTLRMPATLTTASGEVLDETVFWDANFGDESIEVEVASAAESILVRVWTSVAITAGILLLVTLATYLLLFALAKWRTPKGRRRRDVRRRQLRAATREREANRPRRRSLRLLVVDVHGVLVRPTNPLEGVLLPLIVAENADVDPQQVRDLHRKLVLGRLSPAEFWNEVELSSVSQQLETRYLSSFKLLPGLHAFLIRMKRNSLPVAAIGNQPRAWGDRLRTMTALDELIASWMVSGDVGSTLPEPALFEATRRTMSVDLYDCFYLSNIVTNLDVAEELGMATGLFLAGNDPLPETEHNVIYGFEDLLKTRGS